MDWRRIRNGVTGVGASIKESWPLAVIATIVILITIIIIALILTLEDKRPEEYPLADTIECPGLTEENCTKLFCFYKKVLFGPYCFMKRNSFGYLVKSVTNEIDGPIINLQKISTNTPYGKSIENVAFKLTYLTENILRFQFKDADNKRYEVPVQENFPLLKNLSEVNMSNLSYEVIHTNKSEIFQFGVRRQDGTYLWDTRIGALLLSDQYLQIASYLPTSNVYGLGEHVHDTLRHSMNYTSWPMFARDRAPKTDGSRKNLYGVHPFYTCLETSGKSHGVLFLNSNAMEVTFLPAPAISFRTIGGILDFFIFVGDNPEHVIKLYTSLIGRPMIPPYWALGFQLSRYGYRGISNLEIVINRTRDAEIPQAVQYLDIDHMQDNKDFTFDDDNFPDLPSYINYTKENYGLKWVIILDPALSTNSSYVPYKSGLDKSIYVKRSPKWKSSMFPKRLQDINATIGKVWPKEYAVFPDFFLNETKEWWKEQIIKHKGDINFDGLWIDMNEPANFGTNVKNPQYCFNNIWESQICWALNCPKSKYEDPLYNPLKSTSSDRLSKKTICMESIQGNNATPFLHYDVHSLYGWSQTQATLEAAQAATGTRSLVITRSTYPSSGRYAGHWLGDNHSTIDDLRRSIIGILEFNLFGIPYIGADVCGFYGVTTSSLCKRWMQLGAFYPYYRNHNALGVKDQDPAFLGPEVASASKKAVERRLKLNPYLYTLFYRAHVDGSTVIRPVFHEFPNDSTTWNMDSQFMWGHSMLIAPILEEARKSLSIYLPKNEWWYFNEEKDVIVVVSWESPRNNNIFGIVVAAYESPSRTQAFSRWSYVSENCKSWMEPFTERYVIETRADEYTPIYIRGGTILPYGIYDPDNYPENSTTRNITLFVFPQEDKASGELFMDDGISVDTVENEAYALYQFKYSNCSLTITSQEYSKFSGPNPVLNSVVVFKVKNMAAAHNGIGFILDEKLHTSTISVNNEMKNVPGIQWEASGGSCQMLP